MEPEITRRLPREEVSQSRVRIYISALGALLLGALAQSASGSVQTDLLTMACLGGLYFLLSLLWLPLVRYGAEYVQLRRYVSLITDLVMVSLCMAMADAYSTMIYPLYLWIIVGNGMRFGLNSLFYAMALGVFSFACVLYFSPYWQANLLNGLGLLFSMVVLPSFYIALIRRLHSVNRRLKRELSRAERAAREDPLTGLHNRPALYRCMENSLESGRYAHIEIGFIDMDGFKQINDQLGHRHGDELLIQTAGRLKKLVEQYGIAARLGGDEFAVICRHCRDDMTEFWESVRSQLSEPYEVAGQQVTLTASTGVAAYPQDGDNVSDLLHRADLAMYRAKQLGRDTVVYYKPELETLSGECRLARPRHQE